MIDDETDYEAFQDFVRKHPVFVVKPAGFDSGRGIRKDCIENYSGDKDLFQKLLDEKNLLSSTSPKKDFLSMKLNTNLILEEIIEQIPEMASIHPQSLNLIRITTFKTKADTKILYSSFKIGSGGKFLNNPAVGSFSAMINPQNGVVETGLFDEYEHAFTPLEYHPDTNIKIRGFQIPHWDEAVALAKECASKLENVNYVGWDLALTSSGWCVLEGNDYGGVVMPQIAYRRGIKPNLEELIDWKPDKQFWWQ